MDWKYAGKSPFCGSTKGTFCGELPGIRIPAPNMKRMLLFWKQSFRNKKQDIMNLRNDEMVCYMIKKVACVPRYSRLIIKLFEKRYIGILWWVIRLKLWMKTNLKTFFGIMKKKLN